MVAFSWAEFPNTIHTKWLRRYYVGNGKREKIFLNSNEAKFGFQKE
jgi:hypothetical protein